jgi:hypothetical protein
LAALSVACGEDKESKGGGATGGNGGSGGSGSGGSGSGGTGNAGSGGGAGAGGEGGVRVECESPPHEPAAEIAGAYVDDFNGTHLIRDDVWVSGSSTYEAVEWSDAERYLVARNGSDNEYSPDLFSRFEWTYDGLDIYYCQVAFDAADADEALAADSADPDDLAAGCSGFSWSLLSPIELLGGYEDGFGGDHEVSAATWLSGGSVFHLLEVSNEEDWAVAQNDCDNQYNPGLYTRFDWTTAASGAAGAGGADGGTLYYCQTGYAEESAEAARDLSPADVNDLETGCNGFSWSSLTPEM